MSDSPINNYEPYHTPQTMTIQTPNGLAGIPVKSGGNYTDENGQQWMCDEINCEKQERIQRIGECVFDGSEDWFADYISNQVTKRYRTRIPDIIHKKQLDEALCSHFSFVGYGDDRIGFFQTNNNTDFYLKTMFETVDELKKWLSNNNVTVKYILKTPIRTPLTSEEIAAYKSLHTYSPNTTVTNDAGCGMSMEYIADTKTYIQSVEDKITAIQAALINQNISGGGITVDDAAELPISDLQIFGKSEQVQTTGAQLLDAKKLEFGGLSGNTGTPVGTDNRLRIAEIEIKPKETYSISGYAPTYVLQNSHVFNVDGERLSSFLSGSPTPDGAARVSLCFKKSDDSKMTETDIQYLAKQLMLNVGGESLPWEPYTGGKPSPSLEYPQEITSVGDNRTLEVKIADSGEKSQRLIIQTPNGLPGIPVTTGGNYVDETGQRWITDEVDLEKEERIQRLTKIIFDGSDDEDWTLLSNSNPCIHGLQIAQPNDAPLLCNHFIGKPYDNRNFSENGSCFCSNLSDASQYVRFITSDFNDVDLWRKFLQDNPIEILVISSEPIRTPLAPKEIAAYKSLHTYSGTTLITNDSGAGMSLTYTVDTKKYVDKKIAAISAAMIGG